MRGDLVSRPISDVVEEAKKLVESGVRELLVISQDTSAYGVDMKYKLDFVDGNALENTDAGSGRRFGRAGHLGATALCVPLSQCGQGHSLDGRGKNSALSGYSLPACQPKNS